MAGKGGELSLPPRSCATSKDSNSSRNSLSLPQTSLRKVWRWLGSRSRTCSRRLSICCQRSGVIRTLQDSSDGSNDQMIVHLSVVEPSKRWLVSDLKS